MADRAKENQDNNNGCSFFKTKLTYGKFSWLICDILILLQKQTTISSCSTTPQRGEIATIVSENFIHTIITYPKMKRFLITSWWADGHFMIQIKSFGGCPVLGGFLCRAGVCVWFYFNFILHHLAGI